ncbi:MAG: hypothetical protein M0Z50_02755 [Planctomycetia bacterium]|nr:hypothetical protein [Planctomycetia bacterium]
MSLTHLPPPIRELIGQALQGKELVDLETLELSEAQSFGGLGIWINLASIYMTVKKPKIKVFVTAWGKLS